MVDECRHIKTSGGKCASPALRGKPYCYFHARLRARAARPSSPYLAHDLPTTFEDRGSIQLALSEVIGAIAEHRIDTKRAGMLLYALQIASSNVRHQEEIVCSRSINETVTSEEGDEIAPEGSRCGTPDGEPTLGDILLAEIKRHRDEYKELNPLQPLEPAENRDFSQNGEGEGALTPW